jgi:hypothetical protein
MTAIAVPGPVCSATSPARAAPTPEWQACRMTAGRAQIQGKPTPVLHMMQHGVRYICMHRVQQQRGVEGDDR